MKGKRKHYICSSCMAPLEDISKEFCNKKCKADWKKWCKKTKYDVV